jgi:hypothetical protein
MRALLVSEGKHDGGGALQALVSRTADGFSQFDWRKISDPCIHVRRGKGKGFFKRAVAWMREANKTGFDSLILVIDEDGDSQRNVQITEAQQCELIAISRALGVAIRTFDAWMLADEKALSKTLRMQVENQLAPEKNRDPKRSCAAILAASGQDMSQAEFYAVLSKAIDTAKLENRCPKGFAPFASRVRAIA